MANFVPGLLSTILAPLTSNSGLVTKSTQTRTTLTSAQGQHSSSITGSLSVPTHTALNEQTATHFISQILSDSNEAAKTASIDVSTLVTSKFLQRGTNTTRFPISTSISTTSILGITPTSGSPTIFPAIPPSNSTNSTTSKSSPGVGMHGNWILAVSVSLSLSLTCLGLIAVQRRRRRRQRTRRGSLAADITPFESRENDLVAPFNVSTNAPTAIAFDIGDINTDGKRRIHFSNPIVHVREFTPQKATMPLRRNSLASGSTRVRTPATLWNVNNVGVLETIAEATEATADPSGTENVVAGADGSHTRTLAEQVQVLQERLRLMEDIRVTMGLSLSEAEREENWSSEGETRELVPPPRYTSIPM